MDGNSLLTSKMKCLMLLIIMCCVFVMGRLTWTTYEYGFGKVDSFPKRCECKCFDSKLQSQNLETSVHYSGPRTTEHCGCEEFFVPRMKEFEYSIDMKALCEICDCDYAKNPDVAYITMTYLDLIDIVALTIFFVSLLLVFQNCLQMVNSDVVGQPMQQSRERRLKRAFRVVEEFYREKLTNPKGLLSSSEFSTVNTNKLPEEKENKHNYHTFYSDI